MAPPWDIQKQKSFQLHPQPPTRGSASGARWGLRAQAFPQLQICHYATICLSVVQSQRTHHTTNFCQWLLDNSMTNHLGDTPEWANDHSGLDLTLIDPL